MNKRICRFSIGLIALGCFVTPPLAAQDADLVNMLNNVKGQIASAEQEGVDESQLAPLRVMVADIEQQMREQALEEADAAPAQAATAPSQATPATYAAKQNLLAGEPACSDFSEANYRQLGLSEGPNVQLNTMCAQAFEYYTMYKRAIAQGYSEIDAERTFAAHETAAKNAIAFYASTRSD